MLFRKYPYLRTGFNVGDVAKAYGVAVDTEAVGPFQRLVYNFGSSHFILFASTQNLQKYHTKEICYWVCLDIYLS